MESNLLKNKKGVSAILGTIIMIALVLVIVGIVWGVVNNLIEPKLKKSESCFGIFEQITINDYYTCYDSNSTLKELKFAINVNDLEVDGIVVGVFGQKSSTTFKIPGTYPYLKMSNGNLGEEVTPPGENSGLSYVLILNDTNQPDIGTPEIIKIAPIINEEQCDFTEVLSEIAKCNILSIA